MSEPPAAATPLPRLGTLTRRRRSELASDLLLCLMSSITVSKKAELSERVLSYCDKAILSRYARVCKLWMEPAVDALWRDIISPTERAFTGLEVFSLHV